MVAPPFPPQGPPPGVPPQMPPMAPPPPPGPPMGPPAMQGPPPMDPAQMAPSPEMQEPMPEEEPVDPMQAQMEAALDALNQLMAFDDGQLKDMLEQANGKEVAALKNAAKQLMPELFKRIEGALGELANPGPRYPEDYPANFVKPKKPTTAQMLGAANSDESEYGSYRERVRMVRRWLMMKERGRFKYENNKQRKEEYRSPQLHNEWQMRAQIIGSADMDITMPVLHPTLRAHAQEVEDFAYWAWERVKEQHADMFNGPLEIDEAKYADSCGMVVYRCLMDPMEPRFPWLVELMDPTTVFPVPGGPQGLLRVTRKYHTTLGKALDSFDIKGTLSRKLLNPSGGEARLPLLTDDVEVVEYYDRWWMAVYVSSELAYMTAHKYGYVPFIIQVNGFGLPLSTVGSAGNTGFSDGDEVVTWNNWSNGALDKQIVAHGQLEALMNESYTTIRRMGNPAWFRKYGMQAAGAKNRGVDLQDGVVNPMLDAEEFNPILTGPPPQYLQPVMADIQKAEATGMLPPVAYGMGGAANTSGNAMSGMDEAGRDKLFATIKTCELARQRLLRMMLRMMADWGDMLGEEGKRGRLVVPYAAHRRATNDAAFELTAETVKATSVEVTVRLRDDPLDSLLPRVNAANLAIQAGIMSRRHAIDLIRVRDPQSMIDEIIEEKAYTDDRMIDLYTLRVFMEQAGLLDKLPEDFWVKQWVKAMQGTSQQGQPNLQGDGPNGEGGGGAPAAMNPGVNTSATNMQAIGQGQVGATGRPTLPPMQPGVTPGIAPGGIGS